VRIPLLLSQQAKPRRWRSRTITFTSGNPSDWHGRRMRPLPQNRICPTKARKCPGAARNGHQGNLENLMSLQDRTTYRQDKSPAQEQIRARFKKVTGRSITSAPDDYARVIRLIVLVRDELELAGRSPGDLVTITRQANDALINDLAIVSRLIRKMAER
jgi:hypothetical protein